jgi:hypothetical protein
MAFAGPVYMGPKLERDPFNWTEAELADAVQTMHDSLYTDTRARRWHVEPRPSGAGSARATATR